LNNKYPQNIYFTGLLVFFLIFHFLGTLAASFSDGVLLGVVYLLLKANRDR